MTDEERKLLQYLKEVSAPQLLKDMSGGKVLGADLRAVGKLRIYRLPDDAINVLLYCAKLNMNTPDYRDVYKTAARWRRLRVKNAEEAFELAKKEYSLDQQNK
ncbi:replication initiation and membrane attachment family protein [Domibacillus indicus]|uniref:hypothetical protein n=1 Tax=Domibacillus indicus TaxID=1437523 RepID=UPI000618309C|nr:hypothetical protein [Domibacillus indicus]